MNKAFVSETRSGRTLGKPVAQLPHVGKLTSLGRALKALGRAFVQGYQNTARYEELTVMSGRDLAAMGITRADFPSVMARTRHGARPVDGNVITLGPAGGLRSPGA